MPRPVKCRRIEHTPAVRYFKPAGIPLRDLDEIVLLSEEVEALRLADLEGLYHEDCARSMEVSRATFGTIVATARKKTAQAMVQGLAIRIQGLEPEIPQEEL